CLKEETETELADVAYTLQVGRASFAHRSVVVCRDRDEAIALLEQEEQRDQESTLVERRDRPVAFLFGGEGAFNIRLMRELYWQEEHFRQEVDHCCNLLKAAHGFDLQSFLFSQDVQTDNAEVLTQLAYFVAHYALTRTMIHRGIQPQALYGSGRAEYVAACLAGVLTPEDALALVIAQASQKVMEIEVSRLSTPQMTYISALTGAWVSDEQVRHPQYWMQSRSGDPSISAQAYARLHETGAILLHFGPIDPRVDLHAEDTILVFPETETAQPALKALPEVLGKLWRQGVSIDWAAFSSGERCRRVALPTYPFERKHYWIDSPEEKLRKQRLPERNAAQKLTLDDWFYVPAWERQPLEVRASLMPDDISASPLLLFMDESGLATRLARSFAGRGQTVIQVSPGTHYKRLDAYNYIIRPAERVDYDTLCQELFAGKDVPRRIIHAWNVDAQIEPRTSLDNARFERAQERGFYSLLWLAQSLGQHLFEGMIHLYVLATQMLALSTDTGIAPEKAPVLGAGRVIPQEYLNITCRIIDIDQVEHPELMAHLLSEVSVVSSETIVAYRNDERWVQRHERVSLVSGKPPRHLRSDGTYLITGGLGNIGLELAEYLTQTIQARLVLVGRSVLPARTTWENWLEQHETTDVTSQKIQRLLALEAQGARILILAADVADYAQLETAFVQAEQQFGPLNGVIHAAGITSEEAFKTISYLEEADCALHFRPKVQGLFALERAMRGRSLDFCLLFSSLSTVLGGLSLVAYTAANAFMEAFAQQRNQGGTPAWISVAWDTWQFKKEQRSSPGATVTPYSMSVQEGKAALERVLSSQGITHLVHSTGDLSARIRQWVLLEALRQPGEAAAHASSGQRSCVPRQRSEAEHALQEIWHEVLGLQEVGLYDNFFDLGGNSLTGLQVMARLRKVFQVQLPVVTLFEAPSISALVER
ncbi:MAG TPA: SDR family NAD(P)-dependent oxidoreductase, partial [Ktedonobacteraceae bacterium]|nr:SDR family NAD(P)-dependent oxidoreductase [Ktedonobacteraceae bacterium]